mgnify:CR=1 FL=1
MGAAPSSLLAPSLLLAAATAASARPLRHSDGVDGVVRELDALLAPLERSLERRSIFPLEKYDTQDEWVDADGKVPSSLPDRSPAQRSTLTPNEKIMRNLAVRDDQKWSWLFGDYAKKLGESEAKKRGGEKAGGDGEVASGGKPGKKKMGGRPHREKSPQQQAKEEQKAKEALDKKVLDQEGGAVPGAKGRVERVEQNVVAQLKALVPKEDAEVIDAKGDGSGPLSQPLNWAKTVAAHIPRGTKTLMESKDQWIEMFKAEDAKHEQRRRERAEAEAKRNTREGTNGPAWVMPLYANPAPQSGLGSFMGFAAQVPPERLALSGDLAVHGDCGPDEQGRPCHGLRGLKDPKRPFGDGAWMRNFPYAQPHPEGGYIVDAEGNADPNNPLTAQMQQFGAKVSEGEAWNQDNEDAGYKIGLCTNPAARRALCAEVIKHAPMPGFDAEGKPAGLPFRLLEKLKKEKAEKGGGEGGGEGGGAQGNLERRRRRRRRGDEGGGAQGGGEGGEGGGAEEELDLTECKPADVSDVVTALHVAHLADWSCRLDATSKFVRVPKGYNLPVQAPGLVAVGAEACTPADCEAIALDPLPLPKAPSDEEQQAQFESLATGAYPVKDGGAAKTWSFRGKSFTAQGDARAQQNAEAAMKRRSQQLEAARAKAELPGGTNPTLRAVMPDKGKAKAKAKKK